MSEGILNSISVVLEKIYKSIEGSVYTLLDKLINISPDILEKEPLKYIFNDNEKYGIVFIATSLVLFYVVQYMITKLVDIYSGNTTESTYKFVLKTVIIVVLASNSKYLCDLVLQINYLFTQIIESVGENISGEKICFEKFSEVVLNLENYMTGDNISIDGVLKGFIGFGMTTLLVNYAVRYVTAIFCIIVTPICIMFSISSSTRGIFNSWIRLSIVTLCEQWLVKLLLIIPISFRNVEEEMFKIAIIGTVYLLYKINSFTKEFMGTIFVREGNR